MDGKFFTDRKRGEIHEFKQDLNSLDRSKKKDAVKRIIASMTVGKDVSSLFPDVVNCMQTEDMELKKLVYLYLINYAKTQPDLAIMAVNTFVKDSQDPNPLIRALAVRTMGCIRVDKITEYLCDPLQRCLKDEDPYVRKTAAVCVAKLYDINPEMVEDRGFLDTLKDMIGDANPMVVANAVAALSEIQEISGKEGVFRIDSNSLFKLLRALNECTEWGQVFILDSLAQYTAQDSKDAEAIIERVTPRLQHANSAVVLSAIKVILKNMESVNDAALLAALAKKLAPPLVTLLGSEPEIQYVALRNINLIVQKHPNILAHEVKVFFCKYNDPIYVKMEKLEIMIKLANEKNIDQVLLEFKEYATEVDVDFVRKAVRAIGRCAVSIERAAERCINVLLELIQTKVNYVVQEAIIVIKDIFRRYPNRYESIISTLCENLESLDEPEAKASMIWIIGEYAERIDNADELLEQFLETFPEETSAVQLQLVTATVKLFLKKPTEKPQQLIQLVLTYATQETDNPDLRDRAYIYWRLLSTDPEAAKDVVLAAKPIISDTQDSLDPTLLDQLLGELGTLASVYHKPAAAFVSRARLAVQRAEDLAVAGAARRLEEEGSGTPSQAAELGPGSQPASAKSAAPVPDLLGDLLDLGTPTAAAAPVAPAAAAPANVMDLLGGLDLGAPAAAPVAALPAAAAAAPAPLDDFFATPAPAAAAPATAQLPVLLDVEKGKGVVVRGMLVRQAGGIVYQLTFENVAAGVPLDGFMVQFNKNSLGLSPGTQVIPVGVVPPGGLATAALPVVQNPGLLSAGAASAVLQVAIKCNQLGVLYMTDSIPLAAVLAEDGRIEGVAFVQAWKTLADEQQRALDAHITSADAAKAKLEASRIFVLSHKSVGGEEVLYSTARVAVPGAAGVQLLLELRFTPAAPGVQAFFKSERMDFGPLIFDAVARALA